MSAKPSELSREAGRKTSRVETYFFFAKIHGKINYLCLDLFINIYYLFVYLAASALCYSMPDL